MKWIRKQKISIQLIAVVMITFIVIMASFLNILAGVICDQEEQEERYVSGVVTQLGRDVTQNYNSIAKIMDLVSFNSDLQEFLSLEDEGQRMASLIRVRNLIGDISSLNPYILDIIVIDKNGTRYSMGDTLSYNLPEQSPEMQGTAIGNLQSVSYRGNDISYLTMYSNIYTINSYTQINSYIGTLYFVLTSDALTGGEGYSIEVSDQTAIQLLDSAGNILWESRGKAAEESEGELVGESTTAENLSINVYRTGQSIFDWMDRGAIVYIILVILLVILWGLWTRYLIRPMADLTRFVERIGDSGNIGPETEIHLEGYEEIRVVGDAVNQMLRKIRSLTEADLRRNRELYQSQIYAKQMEISYLRSQINPHFLYNTLDTMCGFAYSRNEPELAELAKALGAIFKYCIKGKDIVPLKDELKIVKSYVFIQSTRFPDRFSTGYSIDEKYLAVFVPKMILQPLVENAITHGIEGKREKCHLEISVGEDNGALLICIIDDGSGIRESRLEELQAQLSGEPSCEQTGASHIGIANVHNRIRLLYGEEYGISIESRENTGTKVIVRLPIQDYAG